jgi:hypothetical protein
MLNGKSKKAASGKRNSRIKKISETIKDWGEFGESLVHVLTLFVLRGADLLFLFLTIYLLLQGKIDFFHDKPQPLTPPSHVVTRPADSPPSQNNDSENHHPVAVPPIGKTLALD